MPAQESSRRKIDIFALAIILALGIFLRIPPHAFSPRNPLRSIAALHPQPAFTQIGVDEVLYRRYVNALVKNGITSYPDLVESYLATQNELPYAILPPVRFLYIFSGYIWYSVFGGESLDALRSVAAFFSVFTLGLTVIFAWRLRGSTWALGIGALMAFAPTQIHMSQHALIDGVFTFWALLCLWLLWENLRAPHDWPWIVAYGLAVAVLVITKENSFFLWIALVVLILTNRWLQFGTVTRELLLGTIAGPLLGVVILVFLAGGLHNLIDTYRLLVSKASQMPYAFQTGDGPWHRYLVDLLLVSPIILVLALGSIFQLDRTKRPELYFTIFVAASYLVMCNVKYGMNLRYANIWDMPLRFLAFNQIVALASWAKSYRAAIIAAAVIFLAAIEFHQYYILA